MGRKFKVVPVLKNINDIIGAKYNPRIVVSERLKQIELSVRYLGFLSPIYVNQEGLILSGHQRTTVAKTIGYTKVPVVTIEVDQHKEEGVNLHFNRATCDLDKDELGEKAFTNYKKFGFDFKELEEIIPDTVYPCIDNIIQVDPKDLVENLPLVSEYMRGAAIPLLRVGAFIPIILEEGSNRVVNGISRVYSAYHRGWEEIPAVVIPKKYVKYAFIALNYLSMDFDLGSSFKNKLRHHAYRRKGTSALVKGLSRTYTYFVFDRALSTGTGSTERKKIIHKDLQLLPNSSHILFKKYKKVYGQTIIDFGAGSLHDSGIMEEAGFTMYPFEPFAVNKKWKVSLNKSRKLTRRLFKGLIDNKVRGVDSIISSYNLNSIPFHKDRMAYLCVASAMCKLGTIFYVGTQNITNRSGGSASKNLDANIEPNMTINNALNDFKVQKFFYDYELTKMLEFFFKSVKVTQSNTTLYAKCWNPKRLPARLLKESLALQFNLPHKKGRLDLVDESIKVFQIYTGMDLSK